MQHCFFPTHIFHIITAAFSKIKFSELVDHFIHIFTKFTGTYLPLFETLQSSEDFK